MVLRTRTRFLLPAPYDVTVPSLRIDTNSMLSLSVRIKRNHIKRRRCFLLRVELHTKSLQLFFAATQQPSDSIVFTRAVCAHALHVSRRDVRKNGATVASLKNIARGRVSDVDYEVETSV